MFPFDYQNLVYILNIRHPLIRRIIFPILVDDFNKPDESLLDFHKVGQPQSFKTVVKVSEDKGSAGSGFSVVMVMCRLNDTLYPMRIREQSAEVSHVLYPTLCGHHFDLIL